MATVPHVTSDSGLRKFQADGFLLDRVYLLPSLGILCLIERLSSARETYISCSFFVVLVIATQTSLLNNVTN